MGTVSEDIRRLLDDCELFVSNILQDEQLSNHARETREILLRNFRVVHNRNPQAFPYRSESVQEESSDDNRSSSLGRSDNLSVASDYQDDGSPEYFEEIPITAAQDLSNILRQGYLEKKRRDHSFFGSEWQKRWCVLNNTIFYYYSNEKDKQQKGSFYINGYSAELVANMRKDSKKNACFELTSPGRRPFQFTASNPREAREWVDQINFVLKDLSSNFIPFDDDEVDEDEDEEETYDDIGGVIGSQPRPPPTPAMVQAQPRPPPINNKEDWKAKHMGQDEEEQEDDDIYEVLPQDEFPESVEDEKKSEYSSDYANYYQGLWDCEADQSDELAFGRGDLIYIISKEYNIHGWWVGEINGTVGIVPKDFLLPAYIL